MRILYRGAPDDFHTGGPIYRPGRSVPKAADLAWEALLARTYARAADSAAKTKTDGGNRP